MAGAVTLHLRLVCAATPHAVAGLIFGRGPARAFGVALRPLADFDDRQRRELLADPWVDVSVGVRAPTGDWVMFPAADIMDLERLVQHLAGEEAPGLRPEPARDTLAVIADHLAAEQTRDDAAPGGDDEEIPNTGAFPATEAATEDAASGAQAQDVPAAAAPEAAVVTSAEPAAGAAETAAFLAAAFGDGAEVTLTTTSLAPPDAPVRGGRKPAKK